MLSMKHDEPWIVLSEIVTITKVYGERHNAITGNILKSLFSSRIRNQIFFEDSSQRKKKLVKTG